MKLQEFIQRYNNQHIEIFNRSAEYQCFDLAELWGDFQGLPRIVFQHANASQIYTNTTPEILRYVDKIPNTPDAIPQAGDIVCWDSTFAGTGGAGHVAVATGVGDTNTFQAFSQNNPISGKSVLHIFNYNKVLGWLRPKKISNNIERKSSFFDKYWLSMYGSQIDTDAVTKEQVEARIKEAKSEKYRGGQFDQLARKAGYTGDTNTLDYQKLYQMIVDTELAEYKKIIQSHLADKKLIRQKTLEEVGQLINNLKSTT